MRWLPLLCLVAFDCAVLFAAWVHFEMRKPAHNHDEGQWHGDYCPGCFAKRVRR